MSLLLPAIALGASDVSWRRVWKATQFNTWRIVIGAVLCAIPYMVAAAFWLDLDKLRIGFALEQTVNFLSYAVLVIIEVSFLSFSYRWFFEPVEGE
jgi:hypothetical protein